MPTLPFLSDSEKEIKAIAMNAKSYGAHYVLHAGLTLYGNGQDDCKTLYFNFLKDHYPDLLPGYEKLFKGSITYSRDYQNDLSIKFSTISSSYGIKNRITTIK
ncbi:MAG: hypothetical protein PHY59_06905 [Methanobacterium sp.]|nr:hypothetical protein [Methanobacterium sp.]